MKFVKLPVAVEAIEVSVVLHWFQTDFELDGAAGPHGELPEWVMQAFRQNVLEVIYPEFVMLETKSGKMRGNKGDWIIQGALGEIYPCPGDVFAKTYREESFNAAGYGGFVIEHADGNRWRTLDSIGMPDWTDDRAEALCVTLRAHAEAYASDDPEDVRIKEVRHGAPIWVANLQYFTALRAILFDESQEPRNRLQSIDNEICRIHPAVPAPVRPPREARVSLLNGPEKTPEEIIKAQAEQLVGVANAIGLSVTIILGTTPETGDRAVPLIDVWKTGMERS